MSFSGIHRTRAEPADLLDLAINTKTTSTANVYGFGVLLGVGAGCQAQTGYAVMQAIVDRSQVSQAISFKLLGKIIVIIAKFFLLWHV